MSIQVLGKRWTSAKARIDELKAEMLEIESELLPLVNSEQGKSRTTTANGYKITVKRPVNRTIDGDAWDRVKDSIPVDLWPIRVKIEPDAKGCEWLAGQKPELWIIASEAITEKMGKPGFTIEEAKDD